MNSKLIFETDMESGPTENTSDSMSFGPLKIVESMIAYEDEELSEYYDSGSDSEIEEGPNFQLDEQDFPLPVDLNSCLALNLAYQELISEEIQNIQQLLWENEERQKILVKDKKNSAELRSIQLSCKYLYLSKFANPYFRDCSNLPAPYNSDGLKNLEIFLLDPLIAPPKKWYRSERKQLQVAVHESLVDKYIAKLETRLELFKGRRSKTNDKAKLNALTKEINELKSRLNDIEITRILTADEKAEVDIDWLKIAATDFKGSRDSENCRLMWYNYQDVKIPKSRWTTKEDRMLKEFCSTNETICWDEISLKLETRRTPFQCCERYFSKLKSTLKIGNWSKEEERLLINTVKTCKIGNYIPWYQVSYYIEFRSRFSSMAKWERSVSPRVYRGNWSEAEDLALLAAVKLYGKDWKNVCTYVTGRHAQQCRERYVNSLKDNISHSKWTTEADKKLWSLVQQNESSASWVEIAKHFSNRTSRQVRQRYFVIKHFKSRCEDCADNSEESFPVSITYSKFVENKKRVAECFNKEFQKIIKSSSEKNYEVPTVKEANFEKFISPTSTSIEDVPSQANFHVLFSKMKELRQRHEMKRFVSGRRRFDEEERNVANKLEEFMCSHALLTKFRRRRPFRREQELQLEIGIKQILNADTQKLPLFAPNLATLTGFKLMLLDRHKLISQMHWYSSKFKGLENLLTGESCSNASEDSSIKVANGNTTKRSGSSISGQIIDRTAEERDQHYLKIKNQFDVLESHFQSLFTWPAMMAESSPNIEHTENVDQLIEMQEKKPKKKRKCKLFALKNKKRPWVAKRHMEKRAKNLIKELPTADLVLHPPVKEKKIKEPRKRKTYERTRESSRILAKKLCLLQTKK